VIVGDLHLGRTRRVPSEAHAPLIVDADAVLAESVAPKSLQVVPRRYPQVVDGLSRIQEEQLAMSYSL
jgi:hypothetical protein